MAVPAVLADGGDDAFGEFHGGDGVLGGDLGAGALLNGVGEGFLFEAEGFAVIDVEVFDVDQVGPVDVVEV